MPEETTVIDYAGNDVQKGDTVITIQGQTSGTVSGISEEDDGTAFICVRPIHQAYGKGVWYAADQVFRVSRPGSATKKDQPIKPGGLWKTRIPEPTPALDNPSPPKPPVGRGTRGTITRATSSRSRPVRKK